MMCGVPALHGAPIVLFPKEIEHSFDPKRLVQSFLLTPQA